MSEQIFVPVKRIFDRSAFERRKNVKDRRADGRADEGPENTKSSGAEEESEPTTVRPSQNDGIAISPCNLWPNTPHNRQKKYKKKKKYYDYTPKSNKRVNDAGHPSGAGGKNWQSGKILVSLLVAVPPNG